MDTPELAARYGPWALILGGTEGVGLSFAETLARQGIRSVLTGRDDERLTAAAASCAALGAPAQTISIDLSDPGAPDRLLADISDLEIGLVICNAGANTCADPVLDADPGALARVIALNITTPLAVLRHTGQAMRDRGHGGMITIGSMSGYVGGRHHAVYAASKAFTRIFSEGLWLELRDHGIDVLHIVLGVTRTPAMERAGLNFDIPGMRISAPSEVVTQALQALGTGPVHIVSGHDDIAAMHQSSDRARAIIGTDRVMRALLRPAGPHAP